MSLPKNAAWFPTKAYGYGWGIPQRWQGWLVLLVYALALAVGTRLINTRPAAYFTIYVGALLGCLLSICIWKGEPPRWRWGSSDNPPAAEKK